MTRKAGLTTKENKVNYNMSGGFRRKLMHTFRVYNFQPIMQSSETNYVKDVLNVGIKKHGIFLRDGLC